MKKIVVSIALLCGLAAPITAHADTPALVDAGAVIAQGSGSGAVVITTTDTLSGSGASTKTSISLPDPIAHPLDFLAGLKALWQINWGLAVGGVLLALAEGLALLGKRDPTGKLAWLGRGRISVVLGGIAAVLTTGLASVTGANAFGWLPFLSAILGAVLAYWHQAGQDPAKA